VRTAHTADELASFLPSMRIWIFNHYAAAPDMGAGTRHYDIGAELVRAGHEVVIFASGFRHSTRRDERVGRWRLVRHEKVNGVRFVWIRTTPYGGTVARALNMISYALMVMVAQSTEARPDVIIGSSVHPLAAVAARLVAPLRRAPFVFEVRDLWPQTLVDLGALSERSLAVRLLRWTERWLYRSAHAVITLLGDAIQYIVEHGADARRVAYIPNGVAFGPRPSMVDRVIDAGLMEWQARHQFVAAYVGTMGRANAVGVALEAAAILATRGRDDIGVLLVGGGPERGLLAASVQQRRLRNAYVTGPIPKRSVRRLLESVDAGILHLASSPVYRYGISPNKLFDYLAASRPVLLAVNMLNDPVLDSGAVVTVPADDPVKFADGLERLADMAASSRTAMGDAGRRYVEEHHDMRVLARRVEEMCRVAVAARGRAGD
jgi:glycosyltransferase involved in cell wall biosynthesis